MSRRKRPREVEPEPDGTEDVGGVQVDTRPDGAEVVQPLRPGPRLGPVGGEYRWSGDILVAPDGHIAAEMRDGELRPPAR